jgi:predicted nuclease of predicted toxin-antitoxin system
MTLGLYADHHVNSAIVEGVRRKGIDVLTAREDGSDRWSDEELLKRANELGRVIFTPDVDFIVLADEWLAAGRPFAGVVFAHQLGVTIGQAIRDLEIVCRVLTPAEVTSQLIRLPL